MYPFASASVLLLPHACSLQSGALSQRRLLLASPTGHVIALSLDTLEPSLSSVDAATVVDMAADKSGDVAHLICSHGDDDTYVESVDRKSRRTWGRSLRASAIAVQSGKTSHVVLGTSTGELLTSDGDHVQNHGRLDLDEAAPVRKLCVKKDRLAACVTSSGRAYLALLRDSPPLIGAHRLALGKGHLASSVAVSPDMSLVAVGRKDSPNVAIFTYAMEHRAVRAQWARELVLFGPSRVDEEKLAASVLSVHIGQGGSVAAMVDGFVEPVLWNALCGSRTGGGSVSGPAPHCRELVFDAYSLFYVRADGTELMRQELVRLRPCLHREPARLVLVGASHVALMRGDEAGWTRVEVPEAYAPQGPIRCAAIDDDKRVAVAGLRGFAVYFSNARKWRLFQNVVLEEALVCLGLVWLPGRGGVLCCAADDATWKVFDVRERIAAPIELGDLPSPPLAVDFAGADTMVALFYSGVEVYAIDAATNGLSRVRVVPRQSNLLGVGQHIVVIQGGLPSVLPRCLVLDQGGRLAMVDLEIEAWLACRGGVGDVWCLPDAVAGVVVWMLVDGGLAVWSPSLDPLAEAAQGGADVGMDLGHMAIGASAKDGAVVSLDARLGPVGWRVAGATSPCLHGLLQWLLRSRKDGVARRVLAARAQTRVVQSALEDLLQAVLGDALLVPRVVHLLGCVPFPTLASIITHCARQVDPSLWEVLFSVVGAPLDLFEQCLATLDNGGPRSLLRTASELLPILDDVGGDGDGAPSSRARRVLERCRDGDDGALREEVMDYCRKRELSLYKQPSASLMQTVLDIFA